MAGSGAASCAALMIVLVSSLDRNHIYSGLVSPDVDIFVTVPKSSFQLATFLIDLKFNHEPQLGFYLSDTGFGI